MIRINTSFLAYIIIVFFFVSSCHKDTARQAVITTIYPIVWEDRIAQDSLFRKGKWYCTNKFTQSISRNPDLDTIWFINDTLAGWTGYVSGSNAYAFGKTYFPDLYHIIYILPNPSNPGEIDTVNLQCGMNTSQDTFGIYYNSINTYDPPVLMQYVKMK